MNPLETMGLQRKRREEWGACGEWMDGRTEVVVEAGEREVKRARGAAGLGFGLEDVNVDAELGEGDGGGEAVGAGTDYGGTAIPLGTRTHDRTVLADWDALKRTPTTSAMNIFIREIIGGAGAPEATRWRLCGRWRRALAWGRSYQAIDGATTNLVRAFLALM